MRKKPYLMVQISIHFGMHYAISSLSCIMTKITCFSKLPNKQKTYDLVHQGFPNCYPCPVLVVQIMETQFSFAISIYQLRSSVQPYSWERACNIAENGFYPKMEDCQFNRDNKFHIPMPSIYDFQNENSCIMILSSHDMRIACKVDLGKSEELLWMK